MQLTTVKQVQFEKEFLLKEVRQEIKRRHELTLKQFSPKNFDDYIKAMQTNGVKVLPSINKAGSIQGFRFEFNGYNLKGSEVHRSMTGGNIGQRLYGRSNGKLKNIAPVKILDKAVPLAHRLVLSITKKIVKRVVKHSIDAGIGI